MSLLMFDVDGVPGPQGSKTVFGKGQFVESSAKVKPWRAAVKEAATAALIASDEWPTPCAGPVHLIAVFNLERPNHHYKGKRPGAQLRHDAPTYVTSRRHGDLDKLIRSTGDALKEADVIGDDSLIVTTRASKVYADKPGVHLILVTDPIE